MIDANDSWKVPHLLNMLHDSPIIESDVVFEPDATRLIVVELRTLQ